MYYVCKIKKRSYMKVLCGYKAQVHMHRSHHTLCAKYIEKEKENCGVMCVNRMNVFIYLFSLTFPNNICTCFCARIDKMIN